MKNAEQILDSYKDEMLKSLMELIAIPSFYEAGEGDAPYGRANRQALNYMLKKAGEFGFFSKDIDGHALQIDYGKGDKTLGVLTHLDVVPPGDGWEGDPFTPHIKDGLLYGRGAVDNKNSCISCFYALLALKEAGIPLKHKIRLIMGCNEERGSTDMEYYKTKEKMPDYGFSPDASFPVVYAEKGIHRIELSARLNPGGALLSLSSGTAVNVVPGHCLIGLGYSEELLHRVQEAVQSLKLDAKLSTQDGRILIDVLGAPAHASMPEEGKNAASLGLLLLSKLELPENGRLFADLSRALPEKGYDGSGLFAACADEPSGALTMNLGLMELKGGVLTLTLDIRQPVTVSREEVFESIQKSAGAIGVFASSVSFADPLYLPLDHPLVSTLKKVYEEMTGDHSPAVSMGGGTYARSMPNAVAFGPEGLKGERSGGMHMPNEHLCIEEFYFVTKLYLRAMVALAGQEA